MNLGISSYTYTWAIGVPEYPQPDHPLTVFGLLNKATELGVDVVQFADNLPLHSLTKSELDEFATTADSADIQIEVGTRGLAADHLREYLALAERFRSPFVRVVVDTPEHHPDVDEVVAHVRTAIGDFERAGITLAIENHDRFRVRELVGILEAVDSPNLGICLDTVNSFGALEGPEVVVEALAPWTVNLHVKEFIVQRASHNMGFTVEGRPAGQGQLDVPWLLQELAAAGRDVNAIIELWTPPSPDPHETIVLEDDWARQSVAYLRKLIPN